MYGLSVEVLNTLLLIRKNYREVEFKIFGSRARGNYKDNSDIDIAVITVLDDKTKFSIKNDFDNLDIIYKIDLVFLQDILNKEYVKNILKEGVDI